MFAIVVYYIYTSAVPIYYMHTVKITVYYIHDNDTLDVAVFYIHTFVLIMYYIHTYIAVSVIRYITFTHLYGSTLHEHFYNSNNGAHYYDYITIKQYSCILHAHFCSDIIIIYSRNLTVKVDHVSTFIMPNSDGKPCNFAQAFNLFPF